ncbi:uncharacterized protein LOC141855398 [Brevipalpus obovatus]|uniref:uncharacterized protein LOC141855398 n=1 Tax=Brevipalpus obovatus TaxID=246614 RepID=UPI003D9FAF92
MELFKSVQSIVMITIFFTFLLESFLASAAETPHSLLNGCAIRASIPLAGCERRIRDRMGDGNDIAHRCCLKWYLWNCFENELSRNCNETQLREARRFLHFDQMVIATSECTSFPDKYNCDWHFHLLLPLWFLIMLFILIVGLCVGGGMLIRRCCLRRHQQQANESMVKEGEI